ncbi:MAG: non-ribosomal peptide synthase [Acidobacteria bacterium]|nr:non-ribosomal peptide synthase [Acidobacteriota bacterium]
MTVAPQLLSTRDFDARGIAFPIPVLDASDLQTARTEYGRLVDAHDGVLTRFDRAHLYFGWAYDLATHPLVLDAVASLIGHDLVVWGTVILSKPPRDEAFIAWHQDGAYASFLGDAPAVSAWIALSDSTIESGCMRVVPGSQKTKLEHLERHHPLNMLSRGQEIAAEVDEASAVDVELRAGEMSLHHVDIVHGSNRNRASWWRTGFIVRYSTPEMPRAATPVVIARGRQAPHLPMLAARPALTREEALAAQRERL